MKVLLNMQSLQFSGYTADELPPVGGTYALILKSIFNSPVRIGKPGLLHLEHGWYIYTGSAFGPGGLRARIGRHLKPKRKYHWHIDYVMPHISIQEVWYTVNRQKQEEVWAQRLRSLPGCINPLPGFGAGDCRCAGHLFRFMKKPSATMLKL